MNCQDNNIFSIIAIAKFENQYLEEWISYHLKIGFDFIHIYDNSDYGDIAIPEKYKNKVIVYPYSGEAMQLKAYKDFIVNKSGSNLNQWILPMDIDEFLVLKKYKNIKQFISQRGNQKAVAFNWRIFGSNFHLVNNGQSVLSRFTRASRDICKPIKCIFHRSAIDDCSDCVIFSNPHLPKMKRDFPIYNCEGGIILDEPPYGGNTTNKALDIAYIAHFYTKSQEEFNIKRKRARSDNGGLRNQDRSLEDVLSMFGYLDSTAVEDLSALNFYKSNN